MWLLTPYSRPSSVKLRNSSAMRLLPAERQRDLHLEPLGYALDIANGDERCVS
jgi:hypothetical protein